MAHPYLGNLQQLIERHIDGPLISQINCKHFFSGAAAYINGQIFMSLSPAGLALKLSDEDVTELFQLGGTPLRYFAKAPIKKGYAVLPHNLTEHQTATRDWIIKSLRHCQKR